MKLLIGLIGQARCGKGTLITTLKEALPNRNIQVFGTGSFLIEELHRWRIEVSRINLQLLATSMEAAFGRGTLANVLRPQLQSSQADIGIYDCIRWASDLKLVSEFPHIIVYINASAKRRWQRAKELAEKRDEQSMSYEEFLQADQALTEIFIPELARDAQIVLNNDHDKLSRFQGEIAEKLFPILKDLR